MGQSSSSISKTAIPTTKLLIDASDSYITDLKLRSTGIIPISEYIKKDKYSKNSQRLKQVKKSFCQDKAKDAKKEKLETNEEEIKNKVNNRLEGIKKRSQYKSKHSERQRNTEEIRKEKQQFKESSYEDIPDNRIWVNGNQKHLQCQHKNCKTQTKIDRPRKKKIPETKESDSQDSNEIQIRSSEEVQQIYKNQIYPNIYKNRHKQRNGALDEEQMSNQKQEEQIRTEQKQGQQEKEINELISVDSNTSFDKVDIKKRSHKDEESTHQLTHRNIKKTTQYCKKPDPNKFIVQTNVACVIHPNKQQKFLSCSSQETIKKPSTGSTVESYSKRSIGVVQHKADKKVQFTKECRSFPSAKETLANWKNVHTLIQQWKDNYETYPEEICKVVQPNYEKYPKDIRKVNQPNYEKYPKEIRNINQSNYDKYPEGIRKGSQTNYERHPEETRKVYQPNYEKYPENIRKVNQPNYEKYPKEIQMVNQPNYEKYQNENFKGNQQNYVKYPEEIRKVNQPNYEKYPEEIRKGNQPNYEKYEENFKVNQPNYEKYPEENGKLNNRNSYTEERYDTEYNPHRNADSEKEYGIYRRRNRSRAGNRNPSKSDIITRERKMTPLEISNYNYSRLASIREMEYNSQQEINERNQRKFQNPRENDDGMRRFEYMDNSAYSRYPQQPRYQNYDIPNYPDDYADRPSLHPNNDRYYRNCPMPCISERDERYIDKEEFIAEIERCLQNHQKMASVYARAQIPNKSTWVQDRYRRWHKVVME